MKRKLKSSYLEIMQLIASISVVLAFIITKIPNYKETWYEIISIVYYVGSISILTLIWTFKIFQLLSNFKKYLTLLNTITIINSFLIILFSFETNLLAQIIDIILLLTTILLVIYKIKQ